MHRLAVWRAVVATGSVSGAASNLGYTPATISQHIITLQRSMGLTLYERRGRGIEPTAPGRLLAEESAELFASAQRLEHFIEDLMSAPAPRLTIGSFASAAREWLPAVVAGLTRQFPDVQLDIDIHTPEVPAGGLTRDLEIVDEVPIEWPLALTGYRRYELGTDEFVLAVGVGHPLAERDVVSVVDLRDELWIDNDMHDRAVGRVSRLACHSAGYEPHYVARSDDHTAALAMVGAGAGISMVPELVAGGLLPHVRTVRLADPTPMRRIALHVQDATAHLPYVRAARELIEERVLDQAADVSPGWET